MYEGEVTELTPEEAPSQTGGYGKVISHVVIGLKSVKGTKQLKLDPTIYDRSPHTSPDFYARFLMVPFVWTHHIAACSLQSVVAESTLLPPALDSAKNAAHAVLSLQPAEGEGQCGGRHIHRGQQRGCEAGGAVRCLRHRV